MASSAIDALGVDDVVVAVGWCRLVRVQVDALARTTLYRVDRRLFRAPRDQHTRIVMNHRRTVTDVSNAVFEDDEEFGAVVDAQPCTSTAVLVDPHAHDHPSYLDTYGTTPAQHPAPNSSPRTRLQSHAMAVAICALIPCASVARDRRLRLRLRSQNPSDTESLDPVVGDTRAAATRRAFRSHE
jgi:hypothetical protein